MSEDSWSGSDSASDAGSSGSSGTDESASGGSAWGEAAGEVAGRLLGDLLEPGPTSTRSPAEDSAGGALLNPAIRALFLAGDGKPVQDRRSLARQIIERQRWYVPTTSDGSIELNTVRLPDDQLRDAFTVPLQGRQARTWARPRDRSARLLCIWPDDPARPALAMFGYELARRLPANLDGLLLMSGTQPSVGLWRDELKLLTQVADALDLEEILLHPAPGQLAALQSARWYVPEGKRKFKTVTWGFDQLIRVCTHPDAGYEDDHPMQELSGRDLFAQLAAHGGFDGIAIGMGTVDNYQQEDIRYGPAVPRGIKAGVDPRIGTAPLPARTRAEIELWMEITGFPWKDREIVPVDDPPGAVQARSSMASNWRPYETSLSAPTRPAPTLGPVFTISQPDARPGDLGEGQTRVLCAGLLVKYLYEKSSWHPSRWFVSRAERVRAAKLASIALELEKLLVDGRERLPRSAVLTVEGASFLRRRPEYDSRRWIAEMLERHHRTATHWLPSLR